MDTTGFIEQEYDYIEANDILESELIKRCSYHKEHGKCDGCGFMKECQKYWDGFAGTTEDKILKESEIQRFMEKRYSKFQPKFTLTFRD
jgi:hypothetical protein